MKKYIPILKRTKLFAGVADNEIDAMLSCLDARLHTYKKGEYVLRQGEYLNCITVLVDGELHIQRDDYWLGSDGFILKNSLDKKYFEKLYNRMQELINEVEKENK